MSLLLLLPCSFHVTTLTALHQKLKCLGGPRPVFYSHKVSYKLIKPLKI